MNKTDECYICAEKYWILAEIKMLMMTIFRKRENPSLDAKAKSDEPTWHYAGFEYCYNHAKEKLVDMERRMMNKRVEANTVADDVKADEKAYRKSKTAAARALESAIFAKEQKGRTWIWNRSKIKIFVKTCNDVGTGTVCTGDELDC